MLELKGLKKVFGGITVLDDIDILSAIKEWCHEDDKVLSLLSNKIIKAFSKFSCELFLLPSDFPSSS